MAQLAEKTTSGATNPLRRYRWTELGLFILPFVMLILEMIQLLVVNNTNDPGSNSPINLHQLPPLDGLTPILGFIIVVLVAHVILTIFFRKADQFLFPLAALLTGMGVLMQTRLGPALPTPITSSGTHQLLWAIVGIAIFLATIFIIRNPNWLGRYKYTWVLLCIGLILPSVIKGVLSFNSAGTAPTRDVLDFGPLQLQPSEFLKIGLVIFFAAYLNENRDMLTQGFFKLGNLRLPPLRQLGPLIMMLLLCLLIFLIVRELGLALLLYSLFLCLTYLATNKKAYVLVSLAAFALFALIGYGLLRYVRERFAVVSFNAVDWQNWTTANYNFFYSQGNQVIRGLFALCSGGIFGAGLGLGDPADVPVVTSDSVFTAYGEEWGLVGLFAIIGIYLLILHRGFKIAVDAQDPFNKLLAAGLTCVFAIQTFVVIAGNMKFMPLTGIPLPFLSNGANAIMANFIIVGILMRISYNTAVEREGKY